MQAMDLAALSDTEEEEKITKPVVHLDQAMDLPVKIIKIN